VSEWVSKEVNELVFEDGLLSTGTVCQNEYKCLKLVVQLNKQNEG